MRHPVVGRVTAAKIVHELLTEACKVQGENLQLLQHSSVTAIQALPVGIGEVAGGELAVAATVGEVWSAGAGVGDGGAEAADVASGGSGKSCTVPPKLRVTVMPTSDKSGEYT